MTINYFELLAIAESFNLDLTALEKAYFAEQRKYHPDRFIGRPTAERQSALQKSVDINQAYETLKNPLSRAQYLLRLQGIHVGTDADTIKPSQPLLIEILELRENPLEKPALAAMIERSIHAIADFYTKNDWQNMAQETIRLSYLAKINNDHL